MGFEGREVGVDAAIVGAAVPVMLLVGRSDDGCGVWDLDLGFDVPMHGSKVNNAGCWCRLSALSEEITKVVETHGGGAWAGDTVANAY